MRKRLLILMVALILFLTSCEKLPSMREILAYQKETLTMSVRIKDEDTFGGNVTRTADAVTLTLTGNAKTEGIAFSRHDDGTLTVSYDGAALPLSEGSLPKASEWLSLFSLSADGVWKIQRDTMGGIAVLICTESETDVTLYLDAATLLPLRITKGDHLSVDILSASH